MAGLHPLLTAGIAAGVVGGAHWVTHLRTGEESAFDDAGVMWAGIAVAAATFVVAWLIASGSVPTASFSVDGILGNPVWAALIGVSAFIVFMIFFNRGNMWVVNVLAQKEPLAAALGVGLLVWGGGPVLAAGVTLGHGAGVVLLGIGLAARYTALLDL